MRADGVSAAQSPQRGAAVLTIDVVRRREQGRLRTGVFEGFDLGVSDLGFGASVQSGKGRLPARRRGKTHMRVSK